MHLHPARLRDARISLREQRVDFKSNVRRQRFGDDGGCLGSARDAGVDQSHEAHWTAAVMVVDGSAIGRESCNALSCDLCLLSTQIC
jgi:hypothetical protein